MIDERDGLCWLSAERGERGHGLGLCDSLFGFWAQEGKSFGLVGRLGYDDYWAGQHVSVCRFEIRNLGSVKRTLVSEFGTFSFRIPN
ncbi:unnamed protein product, partial [Linum tenue]